MKAIWRNKISNYLIVLSIFFWQASWADSAELIRTFEGHTDSVKSVAFAPNGKRVLSGSSDGSIKLWDINAGLISTVGDQADKVYAIAFLPDGRALSGGGDNMLKLWDVESGDKIKAFRGHTSSVRAIAISPDGKKAVSGSEDFTVKLWDIEQGKNTLTLKGHNHHIYAVAFAPNGQSVLSGSQDGTGKLWDVETGQELKTFQGHIGGLRTVAFSPDGKQIFSAGEDKTIKQWDVATGKELLSLIGHTDVIESISIFQNNRYLLSASADKTVKLWDLTTQQVLNTLEGHTDWVYSVAFSADGIYAISGSRDNTMKLWKVNSPPTAAFTISPPVGSTPLTVTLDATLAFDNEGEIVDYQWSSSDGRKISGKTATLRFDNAGEFTITLTVTDGYGLKGILQQKITVQKLVAAFQISPTTGSPPLTVTLDASSSEGAIANYQWLINNQQRLTGAKVEFTFTEKGIYPITLTVTDHQNKVAATTQKITVNQPPTANFTVTPTAGKAPLTVSLDAELSTNTDDLKYQWDTSDKQTATGKHAQLIFKQAGDYTITLTVTDSLNTTAKTAKTIQVTPPILPSAKFKVTPSFGRIPLAITVDASESVGQGVTYNWLATNEQTTLTATGALTTFTFNQAGDYTIKLTVTDDAGNVANTTQTVTATATAVLTFHKLEESYAVGDNLSIDLTETVPRLITETVDLWVALQLPTAELLFFTTNSEQPFSLEPQPFKTNLSATEINHHLLEIQVTPNIVGNYRCYAVYVEPSKNPLLDQTSLRSPLAMAEIKLID